MSPRRTPSAPPQIDGFEHLRLLGSGGFADVFLYEQQRPRRRVAIKVLLQDLLHADALERFDSEANRMAQLSSHPSIVTIYEADIASDGRPYLAMEYCSRPSLAHTYRTEPLGVAEALRIGIQVAGAVETAHRAGILHRDIKPANILVTEYNRPALTDFGISGTTDGAYVEAEGMSIPWSPPESFAEPARSGVPTDVWALAATVYTLLAGRSPFEIPRGSNSGADLISRIERSALPGTGRSDVPPSLERVFATAMAKRPEARYPTALALARAWQQVQTELSLSVTPVDVLEDVGAATELGTEPDDDPGTRIRQIVTVDPTGTTAAPQARPAPERPASERTASERQEPAPARPSVPAAAGVPLGAPDDSGDTVLRARAGSARSGLPAPVVEQTVPRAERVDGAVAPLTVAEAPSGRRRLVLVGLAALAVVVVVAAGAWILAPEGEPDPAPSTPTVSVPQDPVGTVVPAPTTLVGTVTPGGVVFTWVHPSPVEGDTYLWRPVDALAQGAFTETDEATATVPAAASGTTCVEVVIRRAGKTSATPTGACAP